jgi:anti-sigma regulatory factor (Ser/Thr protein kinase)
MPSPGPSPDLPRDDPGPFEYRFAPSTANIRLARHVLANWLELLPGVDVDAIDDLLVVCSELVTNAVVHAPDRTHTIALRASTEGDSVVLEVEDQGAGFAWPVAHELRDVLDDEEHGRGLFIVEALTDRLGVLKTDADRTVVRCVKLGVLRHVPTSLQPDLSARFRAEGQRIH